MEWSKETYAGSVASRSFWCTPYDDGWDGCPGLRNDEELKQIVLAEREFTPMPDWVEAVAAKMIGRMPMCGHYLFPLPLLEIVDSIGQQRPLKFMHGCFTVERERKRWMMDYCLCLDAWLAGAAPEAPALELSALSPRKIDWPAACRGLWEVLGERTRAKELLVERLLHLRRHQIKERVWDNDPAAEFGRDQYLGDYYTEADGRKNPARGNCTVTPVHGFAEDKSPRVRELEKKLAAEVKGWDDKPGSFRRWMTEESWLCAPKEFRYMERLLWAIGKGSERVAFGHVPGFLKVEDTYPDRKKAAKWFKDFKAALEAWWKGEEGKGEVAGDISRRLGNPNRMKRWLVRLCARKVQVLAASNRMVCNEPEGEQQR